MSNELKPCPFCGGEAKICMYEDDNQEWYGIECANDECEIVACTILYRTAEKAAEVWNRRIQEYGTQP